MGTKEDRAVSLWADDARIHRQRIFLVSSICQTGWWEPKEVCCCLPQEDGCATAPCLATWLPGLYFGAGLMSVAPARTFRAPSSGVHVLALRLCMRQSRGRHTCPKHSSNV